ncbi:helix-turn-helix transcriptional regulator [Microbacterium sp. HA-8]|uniref:helix-turn-helix transcriptional regulator n=1 Tax=Microbacterium sp. HA-8 TaxID=3234200 RepID=UPI0038F6D1CC
MTQTLALLPPTDAATLPLLLTTAEAAAVLRLAPKTLRNWLCDWETLQRGPEPVKLGGRRVYRRSDVLAYAGIEVAA